LKEIMMFYSQPSITRRILFTLLMTAGVSITLTSQAQTYPIKPVTWVVPFAAGGPTDALARSIAERTSRELGQNIVIENAPGAGGTVGAAKVAKASNDGYTMLVGHMGYMGAAPALYKKLAYDPVKDFEAVFRFPDTPLVLMVRSGHPAQDIKALANYAKQNRFQLTSDCCTRGQLDWHSSYFCAVSRCWPCTH
jgi:tripartite-type tricarboxylate transporter receptor subunit TctC